MKLKSVYNFSYEMTRFEVQVHFGKWVKGIIFIVKNILGAGEIFVRR